MENVSAGVPFDDRLPFALHNWYIQFLHRPPPKPFIFCDGIFRMPPSITCLEVDFGMGKIVRHSKSVLFMLFFFFHCSSVPSFLFFFNILIHYTSRTFRTSTTLTHLLHLQH